MTLKEHTLDLVDKINSMTERLNEIEEEKVEVRDEAIEFRQSHDEEKPLPSKLEDRWDNLDAEEISLRGEREKMVETVVGWCTDMDPSEVSEEEVEDKFSEVESCEFVVKELTFGQLQGVSDDMMEASFEVDMERQDIEGTPKQGYYQIEFLRESIISQPSGAPTTKDDFGNEKPEPAEYPIPIGEWLFEKVDALNTAGNTEMGNSSLQEAMKLKK